MLIVSVGTCFCSLLCNTTMYFFWQGLPRENHRSRICDTTGAELDFKIKEEEELHSHDEELPTLDDFYQHFVHIYT
jgi:hypothetical protein